MLLTFLVQLAVIALSIAAMELSSPGFLPVVCPASSVLVGSVAECLPGPFAVLIVLLAGLFLAVLRLRRELTSARAAAQREARRKSEIAWDLMSTRNKFMHTDESVRVGRAFKPRASDVFIVTYPKCGTTWMTQILHALRTGGSLDFG